MIIIGYFSLFQREKAIIDGRFCNDSTACEGSDEGLSLAIRDNCKSIPVLEQVT